MFTKFGHETYIGVQPRNQERHFRKFSLYGSFAAPKKNNLKSKIGQTGASLRAGYRSRDALQRYTIYPLVQGPGSFKDLVNLSLRRTVSELRAVKFAQFSDFGLFSTCKTPKTYPLVTSLQPRGYIAE